MLTTIVLALSCQACSFSYLDANGDRHVIGLVDITVHPAGDPKTFAGDVVDVTTLGFAAAQTAQGGFIALGYNHEVSAALRDNVSVTGNPLNPLGDSSHSTKDAP